MNTNVGHEVVIGDNNVVVTATGQGGAIDMLDYDGAATFFIAHNNTAGTAPTLACKLVHSETTGGTYTDVPNGAFAAIAATDGVKTVSVDVAQLKGFVKLDSTIGGTASPSFSNTFGAVARKKYQK